MSYQEVQVLVTLVYSAEAGLSYEQLRDEVMTDVHRLLDADSGSGVELQAARINTLLEEAHIYGPSALPDWVMRSFDNE